MWANCVKMAERSKELLSGHSLLWRRGFISHSWHWVFTFAVKFLAWSKSTLADTSETVPVHEILHFKVNWTRWTVVSVCHMMYKDQSVCTENLLELKMYKCTRLSLKWVIPSGRLELRVPPRVWAQSLNNVTVMERERQQCYITHFW